MGDRYRIEHVLHNILSNAVKYSDEHSAIEITVVYERFLQDFITFSVRDHGPGISDDAQKQLFTPYVTNEDRPTAVVKGHGTGLGLSICKTIITLLDGTIGCRSIVRQGTDRYSGGSEFHFSLHVDRVPFIFKHSDAHAIDEHDSLRDVSIEPWTNDREHWLTSLQRHDIANSSTTLPSHLDKNETIPPVDRQCRVLICDGK